MIMDEKSFVCNICHGNLFSRGPGGRLSSTNILPYCCNCHSLERHRALRRLYTNLFGPLLGRFDYALQLSSDMVVPQHIFKHFELSVYNHTNSIDIMSINRPDSEYDWIICNHVLEHVKDDKRAISELFRILSGEGVLQLSVPNPVLLEKTIDWGYADDTRHGHFREYGRFDFPLKINEEIKTARMFVNIVLTEDPVTEVEEYCYFFTRSEHVDFEISDILQSQAVKQSRYECNFKK